MLSLFLARGITNEFDQLKYLAAALKLKREAKDKIVYLKELDDTTYANLKNRINLIDDEKTLTIINELLEIDENELINEIMNAPEEMGVFDFRTPEEVAELMDYTLKINDDTKIIDFYSGMGKIDEVLAKRHNNVEIDGFEINNDMLEIAKLKMYAIGIKNVHYYGKDVLINNIEKEYQYAVADTPIITRYDKEIQKSLENDCIKLNIKMSGRISTTWMTAIKVLASLNDSGKAVITTIRGSLFNTLDREIRQLLIERGYIEAIIDLPSKIVPYTNADISLIVLNKSKTNNYIKFINLKESYYMRGKLNVIDFKKAKKTIEDEYIEIGFNEIRDNDYSLNMNKYTGKVEVENGKPLGDITWDLFRGYQITSSELNKMLVENEKDMNYKILEISNINDDGEICSELKMISTNGRNLDRYLLKDGDIVISARGDKIKKCLINIGLDERIIVNGSINVIRPDQNRVRPLYLKSFLDSQKGTISLNNIKSGVTIPSINVGDLRKMIVPCPSMDEQKKIINKIETKLEAIKSTTKRLNELKQELKDMTDLI